jgi:DNA processing protein
VTDDALAAVVALARRVGIDSLDLAEEIERARPQDALLRALQGSPPSQTSLFADDPAPLLADSRRDLERWRAQGLRILTVLDDAYPHNLCAVHDRPALLFVAGELTARDDRAIAVVGSRDANDLEREAAATIACDLVAAGHTVVSGLAAGIDTAAHTAAIGRGGRTLAVVGNGLDHAYPPQNAALQDALAHHHAVVSPFWPESPPSAEGWRRRNGVMSGLSRGTVIVAAGPRSGTRVQARLALAHGRPVFLLEAVAAQPWAAALAALPNVHVVHAADEVVAVTDRLAEPLADG